MLNITLRAAGVGEDAWPSREIALVAMVEIGVAFALWNPLFSCAID
jgi:hypothetical protein